jgi:hypothetical protein
MAEENLLKAEICLVNKLFYALSDFHAVFAICGIAICLISAIFLDKASTAIPEKRTEVNECFFEITAKLFRIFAR